MGKASKRRPKKDPNAPKAAKKAYQWFCDAKRANLKTAQPHLSFGEIAKELSKMWQAVGEEEKVQFKQAAENDKARYKTEMENYRPPEGYDRQGKKRTVYYYRWKDDDGNVDYEKSYENYDTFLQQQRMDGYLNEECTMEEITEEAYYADERWREVIAKKKWAHIALRTRHGDMYCLREWQKEQLVRWSNRQSDRRVLKHDQHVPIAFFRVFKNRQYGSSTIENYFLELLPKPRASGAYQRLPPDNGWGENCVDYDQKK